MTKKIKAYFEVLSNFTNKSLEREFSNKQLCRFLVTTNFTEGDGSGPETMGLLDTTSGGLYKLISKGPKAKEGKLQYLLQFYEPTTWQTLLPVAYGAPCHQ
jgi:hypothetical protein